MKLKAAHERMDDDDDGMTESTFEISSMNNMRIHPHNFSLPLGLEGLCESEVNAEKEAGDRERKKRERRIKDISSMKKTFIFNHWNLRLTSIVFWTGKRMQASRCEKKKNIHNL